jgi:hypothetical protein
MKKYFPYLPSDTEQRQQADALKEKYSYHTEECFTLIGKYGEMLLVLLRYDDEDECCELPP